MDERGDAYIHVHRAVYRRLRDARSGCRERSSHGVARVASVLRNDQIGEFARAVHHPADDVASAIPTALAVGDPDRLGEAGRAVLPPPVLSQHRKDRAERVGGAHAREGSPSPRAAQPGSSTALTVADAGPPAVRSRP
jgi:hypothetical protein